MQFYEFGAATAPVILPFPGTCCHWNVNFGAVIPLLERGRMDKENIWEGME